MAYVGTPTRLNDPVRTLASVLQGEASSVAGQTAVANVIANRADANYGRYGSDVVSQALGRNQFQGQATPTPQSLAIAQQLYDGTLPRTLTNSLNYAAPVFSGPGATTAPWAIRALNSGEGVNIGGNVFFQNDRGGTPTYNPNATGAAPIGGDGNLYSPQGSTPVGSSVTTSAGSEITGFTSATGNPNDATEVTLGFPGDTAGAGGTGINAASFSQANVGGASVGGVAGGASGAFGLGGITAGGSTVGAGNSGEGGTSAGPVGFNAGGPVTANPDLVSATNKVASNTQAGDKAITDGVKTAGQTIGQAITSQSQSWLDWAKESFVRLAFIVTGLVLFAAALYYFARPQIDAAINQATGVAAKGAKLAAKIA